MIENDNYLLVFVRVLEGQINSDVTLDLSILPEGTGPMALHGEDFQLLNYSVSLGPESMEAIIIVEIIDDLLVEGRENFTIELLSCCDEYEGTIVIQPNLAVVTIEDNGKWFHILNGTTIFAVSEFDFVKITLEVYI